jgi:antitoxin ParD1/3/4
MLILGITLGGFYHNMNVSLTPELEDWVDERVRSGRYASASEVIREALRLLEVEGAAKQRRRESVRQKIDRGLEPLTKGQSVSPQEARSRIRAARRR